MARVTAMEAATRHMDGPFRWWWADCCTSACKAFSDIWGINPMSGYPEYRDMRGAARFLREFGGRDGCPVHIANKADLVESDALAGAICSAKVTRRRWALGISVGGGFVAFKGPYGMTIKRPSDAQYWVPKCHK